MLSVNGGCGRCIPFHMFQFVENFFTLTLFERCFFLVGTAEKNVENKDDRW